MQNTKSLRTTFLAGAALFALTHAAIAQDATTTGAPRKHRHHLDRLDLLEQELHTQAEALKKQSAEIDSLKAQLGQQTAAAAPAQPVTPQQFSELQNKVDQVVAGKAEEKKDGATVKFTRYSASQKTKTVPTISSADGRYAFQPFVLLQGDYASYSKGQPLPQSGTNNLKSSGENFRRARIGFQGIIDKDFSYSFVADFGGAGGDETYQAYAGPNTGTTKNTGGTSLTPYTASTASGTGARLYNAWFGYKGFLAPFTFKAGVMSPPANLGDTTQSDDLLFNERPSPSQLSRGLGGDDGRESAGFIGNGTWWNASLFLTGDTFGKGPLIYPATTYGGSQEALLGRAAFRPWYDTDTNFNIHLGANYTYVVHPAEVTSTANPGVTSYPITFADRPELRVDNVTFINTNGINAKNAYAGGVEAAASYGPFLLQGENFWYGIERNNPAAGITNPTFSGWYVEGSWVFWGAEGHLYDPSNASFRRPSPDAPFDPLAGNWGAWEIAGRYSSVDFDHDVTSTNAADRVFGGKQSIETVGLNFYPNDILRFVLDYQSVFLRNIGALNNNGHYGTVSIRTQIAF
ncbi:MAG TPA: porin [Rhizomicrobium sp.]|nr:porin [Rhizomicrobium sp.]